MTDTKKGFFNSLPGFRSGKNRQKDYSCRFDLYSVDYFFAGYNCIY